MRWFRSLQAKYMLIILSAIFLVQAGYILVLIAFTISENMQQSAVKEESGPAEIEAAWHADAGQLNPVTSDTVDSLFHAWKTKYPQASMFWVNGFGRLAVQLDTSSELPEDWTASQTARFIKDRYDGDPFTVIAFAGQDEANGFIVFEIERDVFDPPLMEVSKRYGIWLSIGMLSIIGFFIVISFLFFRGIRRRLLHLQEAMSIREVDGLPVQTDVQRQDEIGQLEQSFNNMVEELQASKRREQEEEQLRRELIANLSHDLRTPLTKVRTHVYSLGQESLSAGGRDAVLAMERSVVNMDQLIDNLMSYTLLMANKYAYDPQPIDILRFMREHMAAWYPVFEREGFEIEVGLDGLRSQVWTIDPMWMGRIVDNVFQNVLRHAKSGRYIGVQSEISPDGDAIVITDRGAGINGAPSEEKGAGIGMSIVDRMIKGMDLEWRIESGEQGTTIRIIRSDRRRIDI